MKNISFIKKIRLFLLYRKTIKQIENELKRNFNLKIDKASRLYTIFTIPTEAIEEPYNIRRADFDVLVQNFIKSYTNDLSKFLNSKGLNELYGIYEMEKIDSYNYLLIYGYSLFKSDKFMMNLYKCVFFFAIFAIILIILKTFIS
jgi:hypothetical protein